MWLKVEVTVFRCIPGQLNSDDWGMTQVLNSFLTLRFSLLSSIPTTHGGVVTVTLRAPTPS